MQEGGAQLVEFAFALPILLLLIVGIWDFGSAFGLMEKLTNAAREGARIAVSNSTINPTSCTSTVVPCSIISAADGVKIYMTNANVDLSCIDPASPESGTGADGATYTYDCGNGIRLVIDRGYSVVQGTLTYPSTRVTLTYPVRWKLSGFLPSGWFPPTVSASVTMRNLTP